MIISWIVPQTKWIEDRVAGKKRAPSSRCGTFWSRRALVLKAAQELEEGSASARFVASYARMNPKLQLKVNAFFFGAPDRVPRAVIIGPWLYIHSPGLAFPAGVEQVSAETSERKHLGGLHARVRLTDERTRAVLPRLISALKRAGKAQSRAKI